MKLSHDFFSEWGVVPAGVPQDTKLVVRSYDQCTNMEICRRNYPCRSDGISRFQSAVDLIVRWSHSNKLQLDVDKSKELMIDFKRIRQS